MGLFAWTLNQMLTPKFWTLVKRQGFMQSYLKMHRASRSSHYAGGVFGPVKCVGQDDFGNRYYEDFDVYYMYHRRYVEYSDYYLHLGISGDRVPAGWHGWLSYQYDDHPTRTDNQRFVNHHYILPHLASTSGTPDHHLPQGVPENFNRQQFIDYQRDRRAQPWLVEDGTNQFDGKKLLRRGSNNFEDILATKE